MCDSAGGFVSAGRFRFSPFHFCPRAFDSARATRLWLTPLAVRQAMRKGVTVMASAKIKSAARRLRAATPVLITESVDEFVALRKALGDEIKPNGIIEQAWVDDLAAVM
jgi:hypothetical protein